ncbi:MAG TPA: hypothetical protein VFS43_32810 [Polyangiaceae bacterium]|nr:hypothetical protein [Polyangiaceae bacterium]
MKPYQIFVASTGPLLGSALALAACAGAEAGREAGRAVELPGADLAPVDCNGSNQEYMDASGNYIVCVYPEPPICEQLPGGCNPDPEPTDPPEPPPPDPGGGGDPPPPEPTPAGDGLDCSSGSVNCRKIAKIDCSGETPTTQRGCSNSEISDLQAACRSLCNYHGSGSDGVHYCYADSSQSGTGLNPHVYVHGDCDCSDGSSRSQGVFRYCQ